MKMKIGHSVKGALPVIAGAVAAKLIKNLSGKMITNPKLQHAAPLILGLFLSGSKKTEKLGMGMIAVGGAGLVGSFIPSLAGIGEMDLNGIFLNPLNDGLNDSVLNGTDVGDIGANYYDVGDVGDIGDNLGYDNY